MIDKIIQNYKIISKIGEGGMGTVYLAEDIMLEKKVAIKALNPLLSTDTQFLQRFRQEARLQASLDHGNIIRIYTMLKEEDRFLIVMEYIKGKNLRDIIKEEGAINEKRALKIIEDVLSGINYAHKKGIIHRDIKPVNIMITDYDYVKIMDFGIAKLLSDSQVTFTKGIIGTPYYMSPEQIKSPKSVTVQTDLYSLGITFYEILTGKLPFNIETDSDYELLSELIKSEIPDLAEFSSSVSRNTANIVKKLTEKDLNKRYRNCDECLQDIRNKTAVNKGPEKADETANNEKTIIKEFQPKVSENVINKKEEDYKYKDIKPEEIIISDLPDNKEETVKFTTAEETISEEPQTKYTNILTDKKEINSEYREIQEEKTIYSDPPDKKEETVKFTTTEETISEESQPKDTNILIDKKEIDSEYKEIKPKKNVRSKQPDKIKDTVKFTPKDEIISEESQSKDSNILIDKKEKYNKHKDIKPKKTLKRNLPDKNKGTIKYTPANETVSEDFKKKEKYLKSSGTIEPKVTDAVQKTAIVNKPPEVEIVKPGSSKRKYVYIAGAVIASVISIFILNAVFNKNTKEPDKTIPSNVNQVKSLVDFETLKNRINDYLSKAYAKTELSSTQDSKIELSVTYKLSTADDIENQNNYNPFSNEYKKDSEFILNFKGLDSLVYNPGNSPKYKGIYKVENSEMIITGQVEGETNPDKITKIEKIFYNNKVDLKQETEQTNTGDKKNIKKKTTSKIDYVEKPSKQIEPKKDPKPKPPK